MEKNTIRCFIALDLPREMINELCRIQKLIKHKNFFDGKFTEPENLHLTLKFLGEIDKEKVLEVKKRLENVKFKKFSVRVGNVGVFNKKIVRIVWVKLLGKELYDLQKKIDEALIGLFEKEVRFMGHITIARIKKVSDKKSLINYLESLKVQKFRFMIDEFFLKKSELTFSGPNYQDIGVYSLN